MGTVWDDFKPRLRQLLQIFVGMTNVWLGAQSSGRSWVWKKSGKTVKPDESGLPFCACNKQPYHGIQCLTLERQKKDKPLLYGLPCNFEQGFICSNIGELWNRTTAIFLLDGFFMRQISSVLAKHWYSSYCKPFKRNIVRSIHTWTRR